MWVMLPGLWPIDLVFFSLSYEVGIHFESPLDKPPKIGHNFEVLKILDLLSICFAIVFIYTPLGRGLTPS
jgi:hypothetical protein